MDEAMTAGTRANDHAANSVEDKKTTDNDEEFLVSYRGRRYDIRELYTFHPGGKSTLGRFKGKSIDAVLRENPHSRAAYHLFEQFALDREGDSDSDEYESLVDWNAPLLQQVSRLRERYWDWVNLPVNRPIRLFGSDYLEMLSITPWYIVPIFWIPIIVYSFYLGCHVDVTGSIANHFLEILFACLSGVLLWTVLEYTLHRKLFHFRPPPGSKTLITLHFLLHGVHHKAPFDGRRLVFPPIAGLLVAILLRHIWKVTFPFTMVNFITAGTIAGYLCYDLMHYYLHHGAPKVGTYLYTMKRNHNYHHFSHHDQGFGISSSLWDNVLGTDIELRKLQKPIEW